jgi:hypothetical protein
MVSNETTAAVINVLAWIRGTLRCCVEAAMGRWYRAVWACGSGPPRADRGSEHPHGTTRPNAGRQSKPAATERHGRVEFGPRLGIVPRAGQRLD